jgi:antitoxin (DNA-binding transcriptional repressor) of toxin-antitoxin stability system
VILFDLRNNGGEVLHRIGHSVTIVVTRDGAPDAELRPLPRFSPSPTELIRHSRNLPRVNPGTLRRDIASLIDSSP